MDYCRSAYRMGLAFDCSVGFCCGRSGNYCVAMLGARRATRGADYRRFLQQSDAVVCGLDVDCISGRNTASLSCAGISIDCGWDCGVGTPLILVAGVARRPLTRSEEHTSELQSLMRISFAV